MNSCSTIFNAQDIDASMTRCFLLYLWLDSWFDTNYPISWSDFMRKGFKWVFIIIGGVVLYLYKKWSGQIPWWISWLIWVLVFFTQAFLDWFLPLFFQNIRACSCMQNTKVGLDGVQSLVQNLIPWPRYYRKFHGLHFFLPVGLCCGSLTHFSHLANIQKK